MDQHERIEQLLKRRTELLDQLCSMNVIWEDRTPYGSMERHLEMEIEEMELFLNNPPPIQVLWEVGLKKEQSLNYSLLKELGFTGISFSVN
jgi:hypothetical protein